MGDDLDKSIQEELAGHTDTTWDYVGSGQEATVFSSPLDKFGGVGGIIASTGKIKVARRVTNFDFREGVEDTLRSTAYGAFYKNVLATILDIHAIERGLYLVSHIPFPLETFFYRHIFGHSYQFVEGSEGWPAEYYDSAFERWFPTKFVEWNEFSGLFNQFGLMVGHDTCDALYGKSGKNIIYSNPGQEPLEEGQLPRYWKRIDFGGMSCPLITDTLAQSIKEHREQLKAELGRHYELFCLCADYLCSDITEPSQVRGLAEGTLEFRKFLIDLAYASP